jgi:hypothetical protein
MKIQLLCTFSSEREYRDTISTITKLYTLPDKKLFVFRDGKDPNSILITYNVLLEDKFTKFKSTISVHRKKTTSTLFTLNAMNRVIEEENGGVLDKSYQIDWELYRNCLILTNSLGGYSIIDLDFLKVVEI